MAESRIAHFLAARTDPFISVELCPKPGLNLGILPSLNPLFCSVACLSKAQQKSAVFLAKNVTCYGFSVLLHLPGRNLSKREALEILQLAREAKIRNVFALQGDSPQIEGEECDFPYASHLVRFIRQEFGAFFCIAVAGYPQSHPKSPNKRLDLLYLKEKVLSGADLIITQGCFDFSTFRAFVQDCRNISDIPIISGIFLLYSWKTFRKLIDFCSVSVGEDIVNIIYGNRFNEGAIREFGLFLATNFTRALFSEKGRFLKGVHVFSMNNLGLVSELVKRLGLLPQIERPLKLYCLLL